jgi:hypothetical protein
MSEHGPTSPGMGGPAPSCFERGLAYLGGLGRSGDPRGWADGLLPLPVRLLAVLAGAVIGHVWNDANLGQQLAWGLSYAALIAVSLGAAFWFLLLLLQLAISLPWLLLRFAPRERNPGLHCLNHALTFVNRQIGHLEAIGAWLAVALVWRPQPDTQLPFVLAVLLLGEPLVNWLGRRFGKSGGDGRKASGDLYWARRPFIYLLTAVGLALLALRAAPQIHKLAPLLVAVLGGGLLPRYLRHRKRNRQVGHEQERQQQDLTHARAQFRQAQGEVAQRVDFALGPLLMVGVVAATVVAAWVARDRYDQVERGPEAEEFAASCAAPPGGPAGAPELGLFVLADTQLHELGGQRFPGQIELADAFVPVAVRPVELDLLSAATFSRFASVYAELRATAVPAGRPFPWAHLGDFSDLSCAGELGRMGPLLDRLAGFGPGAGVATGNHDSAFTGNFGWSPYWDSACKSGRLEKTTSDQTLHGLLAGKLVEGRSPELVKGHSFFTGWLPSSALSVVSPIGTVHHHGRERGLVGVFVDSSDAGAFDYGVAGVFGTFSDAQADRIDGQIKDLRSRGGAWDDPVFMVFAHHPWDALAGSSRDRLGKLIARLDAGEAGGRTPGAGGPRVLALLTAHTHHAAANVQCVGGRQLREIVVGSTIDPPQEAAVVTVGPDTHGALALRLRTVQAVAREGRTCGKEPAIAAADCEQVMAALEADPACEPLFAGPDRALGADCQALERKTSLRERLDAAGKSHHSSDPGRLVAEQTRRANELFACVCRGGRCSVPAHPLADEQYASLLTGLLADPKREQAAKNERELACLSWAASATQEHKATGMTMADGLRCAFADTTLSAAREFVAVLEAQPCQ